MMNPKSAVASGLLTVAVLGGCPNANRTRPDEPSTPPAPQAARTTSAPLSAPAASASRHPETEGRLIDSGLIIETFAKQFGGKDLKQVPSEFIEAGVFRSVRYLSYEAAQFELNIYGDPQHPAGVEIGVYAGKNSTKEEIRRLMAGLLQKAADRELVHGLALGQDKLERAGLTFEITPPTADDGFGGWWISIYDKNALDKVRGPDEAEVKVSGAAGEPAPKAESVASPLKKKMTKRAAKKKSEDAPSKDVAPVSPDL
ncbi:hypothetical protein [Vitiosangium sp. GDMCC 1.1324]|uniref:hypothetical protein n=1 Tax=Vitiosangium sp. (strain GDMCC 1.1324) TaxID=2138576 RepID=UPI000D357053|nr:hypothetical protein [Vitiosangium sp. GDMCC 1.1324]PTL81662.1 hypothetical protein DAT35_22205 [Vitiosangium sp. GDMCC 1.1324]